MRTLTELAHDYTMAKAELQRLRDFPLSLPAQGYGIHVWHGESGRSIELHEISPAILKEVVQRWGDQCEARVEALRKELAALVQGEAPV